MSKNLNVLSLDDVPGPIKLMEGKEGSSAAKKKSELTGEEMVKQIIDGLRELAEKIGQRKETIKQQEKALKRELLDQIMKVLTIAVETITSVEEPTANKARANDKGKSNVEKK
ncbi:Uncharacterized protein TCM_045194 [Theobroma cacao]|uniref:Uncharacterized protein n=1 Tax=Theobroma cacao TaxID=3641 RepID=A0A061FSZ0_THECC|nr:Uncharacterized protein TCM_045194 [Theobroma cacao]